MIATTAQRVESNTPPHINEQIDQALEESVARFAGAPAEEIDARLAELDREWNTERIIELEAPLMIGLGMALGTWRDRRWYALSAMAAGMVVLHGVQGWYPLLPVLRRLGVRSPYEIERERSALRVLRNDHAAYRPAASH